MTNLDYAAVLDGLARALRSGEANPAPPFPERVMRCGRKVRIYSQDGQPGREIHGAMLEEDGWEPATWRHDGHFLNDKPSSLDLMPEPEAVHA